MQKTKPARGVAEKKNNPISNNRIEAFIQRNKKYFSFAHEAVFVVGLLFIAFILLEAASTFIVYEYKFIDPLAGSAAYAGKDWAKQYFKEFGESFNAEYAPFVGYRRVPNYRGEYINLNEDSLRKTNNNCGSLKIFVFGGSSLWGTGARDEGTIPSLIAKDLCSQGMKVNVTNFGESGYVTMQQTIRLQIELQKGNIPDIVIFYGGFNDFFSSYQNQQAGLHQNMNNRIREFNSADRLFVMLPRTNQIIAKLMKMSDFSNSQLPYSSELVNSTVNVFVAQEKMLAALGKEYGYQLYFYMQPSIYTKTPLSGQEKEIAVNSKLQGAYLDFVQMSVASGKVKDLSGALSGINSAIFIDQAHISEEGNAIIAEKIADDIANGR